MERIEGKTVVIVLTGTGNWTVPENWNAANNTVEVTGADIEGASGKGGGHQQQ